MATPMIRTVVVDDEPLARARLRTFLGAIDDVELVGEAGNGKEAVSLFCTLKPHMLLLDINMPLKSGKEALSDIKRRFPNACVIMLTSLTDKETVEDCIELGASGFIRKDLPLDEMRDVIKQTWHAYRESLKAD